MLAHLLVAAAALLAAPPGESRALGDLYGAEATGATVLLDATFQERGEPRKLYVAERGAIGAILYAGREGSWAAVARAPEIFRPRTGSRPGAARLLRLSATARGFVVYESSAEAGGASSLATLVRASEAGFAALAGLPTDYRGLGAARAAYRGCDPATPRSLPCTRHAALEFVPGGGELDDLELEVRIEVAGEVRYALPVERRRYVFDGTRYVPASGEAPEIAAVIENFFADWLEGRGEQAARTALTAALGQAWPRIEAGLGPAARRHLGYVATGIRLGAGEATADAVPVESAARGGGGRIPVRLVRVDGAWRIAALGENASR